MRNTTSYISLTMAKFHPNQRGWGVQHTSSLYDLACNDPTIAQQTRVKWQTVACDFKIQNCILCGIKIIANSVCASIGISFKSLHFLVIILLNFFMHFLIHMKLCLHIVISDVFRGDLVNHFHPELNALPPSPKSHKNLFWKKCPNSTMIEIVKYLPNKVRSFSVLKYGVLQKYYHSVRKYFTIYVIHDSFSFFFIAAQ